MNQIEKAIKACKEKIKFYKDELKDPRFKEYLTPEEDYCKGRSETYCKMQDGIKTFEFILSVLQEKQRWIPISERWPNKKGHYLTTYREHTNGNYLPKYNKTIVKILRYQECIFRLPVCCDEKAEKDTHREVIAWMPLPEPYKEE